MSSPRGNHQAWARGSRDQAWVERRQPGVLTCAVRHSACQDGDRSRPLRNRRLVGTAQQAGGASVRLLRDADAKPLPGADEQLCHRPGARCRALRRAVSYQRQQQRVASSPCGTSGPCSIDMSFCAHERDAAVRIIAHHCAKEVAPYDLPSRENQYASALRARHRATESRSCRIRTAEHRAPNS